MAWSLAVSHVACTPPLDRLRPTLSESNPLVAHGRESHLGSGPTRSFTGCLVSSPEAARPGVWPIYASLRAPQVCRRIGGSPRKALHFDWYARGKRVTRVSGTNAEADAIDDAIQQRRVDQGELDVRAAAWGIGQQHILVGDTVQTRRNDRLTGVENRAQWIVRGIGDEHLSLVSMSDSGEVACVSTEYAREHLQLAYASTVHGVQGDTADASEVGPDVDAAGLYVGLTRGRVHDVAIVVAPDGCRSPRVPRRIDAARHSGVDDSGCCARGGGGDATGGAEPEGGDGYGAGGWRVESGARDRDAEPT